MDFIIINFVYGFTGYMISIIAAMIAIEVVRLLSLNKDAAYIIAYRFKSVSKEDRDSIRKASMLCTGLTLSIITIALLGGLVFAIFKIDSIYKDMYSFYVNSGYDWFRLKAFTFAIVNIFQILAIFHTSKILKRRGD